MHNKLLQHRQTGRQTDIPTLCCFTDILTE